MWNYDHPTRMETDAFRFTMGTVLEQKQVDGLWHLIAFLSEGMMETERNYEIYDHELMAIIHALNAWRHYLEGLPSKLTIHSDHKNLKYWKTVKNLTCRQAQWSLFLSWFDFEIIPKPGTSMGRLDGLSQQGQHAVKDKDNNLDQVVLWPEIFRLAASYQGQGSVVADEALLCQIRVMSEKETEVTEALAKVQDLGPWLLKKGLKEWNTENRLLLFCGKVYIPKDNKL